VIIPAFGTTLEIEKLLKDKGVPVERYNTTCPFVEKVWNRAEKLGQDKFTTIIHGKPNHEETRATFSHSAGTGQSVIVRNMDEAIALGNYVIGSRPKDEFYKEFRGKYSTGFKPEVHLKKIGVVNQTTMLASETQAIADFFRQLMIQKYGEESIRSHFAETRDTLCYATNDNQDATFELLKADADFAVVVGGYNSSNTSHIVELLERKFSTYFINGDDEIKSRDEVHHFNYPQKEKRITHQFMPDRKPLRIILTSGASCPDTVVDRVMLKLLGYFGGTRTVEEALISF
jgi:4-hydroxy-3-methylbut-2-enyl diphosphate reductase